MEEKIRLAKSFDTIRNLGIDLSPLTSRLAPAIFNVHLLGRAQVWGDFAGATSRGRPSPGQAPTNRLAAIVLDTDFAPLPFQEAIDYFRSKTNLTPGQFDKLSEAAKAKAFTIGGGATRQVRQSIKDLIDQALSEGVALKDFQNQAADILDSAGISERSPWYWETVYRTNMATSYQVGRWQQMTDPDVVAERPYLRYVSALLPTSRPSHREKHGLVYPVEDPFWDEWYPPNGFNCRCTVMSVSESLLGRRGWQASSDHSFIYPSPDKGFGQNAGQNAAI